MMKYTNLGSSDLNESNVCLGSMTWGAQNNQADANDQIELALSSGINFIDTAEMYAVPPTPDTYGASWWRSKWQISQWCQARWKPMVNTTKKRPFSR